MSNIRKIAVLLLFALLSFPAFTQTKKLNKLEMYYDQGNYEVTYRKAKRYQNKPEYDKYQTPAFYKALAVYRMSLDGNPKFTMEKSMQLYREFLNEKPAPDFMEAHKREIHEYKSGLLARVKALNDLNKKNDALALLESIDYLFDEKHNYANVIKDPFIQDGTPDKIDPKDVYVNTGDMRDSIIAYAEQFIGVPYQWGGTTPSGFDCSGFTQYVMQKYKVDLPRIAGDQYSAGKKIDFKKATKGDLVFFGSKNDIQHVGIIVSEPGQELTMIHASSSRGIMVSNIEQSSYWKPRLLHTGRVIE